MSKPLSNSSGQKISTYQKISEWQSLFLMRLHGLASAYAFEDLFENIMEYDKYLQMFTGKNLQNINMLEIGFGARPNRLIALISMGINAIGVDLDQPILTGSLKEFVRIYKGNGFERTLKSIVRHILFDRNERVRLNEALRKRGYDLSIKKDNFIVSDASQLNLEPNSLDLIISEDVFEHIPRGSLVTILSKMRNWLKPDGIAIIRPCIYTGITGGHVTEWFPHVVNDTKIKKICEPWDHLREKKFESLSYLNKLTRKDYRNLFLGNFDIAFEKVMMPDLGKEFLTPELRRELHDYSEEELFSNNVLFILKSKHSDAQ